jgi:hypothetical protein
MAGLPATILNISDDATVQIQNLVTSKYKRDRLVKS